VSQCAWCSAAGADDPIGLVIAEAVPLPEHELSRGIEEAFQTLCRRTYPSPDPTCDEVQIRRHLQIESHRFEVRVLAGITFATAVALIEGSRRGLLAGATDRSAVPATAVLLTEHC
jgi:hypothetical protein